MAQVKSKCSSGCGNCIQTGFSVRIFAEPYLSGGDAEIPGENLSRAGVRPHPEGTMPGHAKAVRTLLLGCAERQYFVFAQRAVTDLPEPDMEDAGRWCWPRRACVERLWCGLAHLSLIVPVQEVPEKGKSQPGMRQWRLRAGRGCPLRVLYFEAVREAQSLCPPCWKHIHYRPRFASARPGWA